MSLAAPTQTPALGRLAHSLADKTAGGKERSLTPDQILALVIQLLVMVQSCYPTPLGGVLYINSQRIFRISKLTRTIKRHAKAAYPEYSDAAIDKLVRGVLFQCKVCTLPDMQTYYGEVRHLFSRLKGSEGSPSPRTA